MWRDVANNTGHLTTWQMLGTVASTSTLDVRWDVNARGTSLTGKKFMAGSFPTAIRIGALGITRRHLGDVSIVSCDFEWGTWGLWCDVAKSL